MNSTDDDSLDLIVSRLDDDSSELDDSLGPIAFGIWSRTCCTLSASCSSDLTKAARVKWDCVSTFAPTGVRLLNNVALIIK